MFKKKKSKLKMRGMPKICCSVCGELVSGTTTNMVYNQITILGSNKVQAANSSMTTSYEPCGHTVVGMPPEIKERLGTPKAWQYSLIAV